MNGKNLRNIKEHSVTLRSLGHQSYKMKTLKYISNISV